MAERGRHASGTDIRRYVWAEIVWPLVLEVGDAVFTKEQYRDMRDRAVAAGGPNATVHKISRGLASLLQKGIIYRENDLYCIHYRLIPYMRLGAVCGYGTAVHEVKSRRR